MARDSRITLKYLPVGLIAFVLTACGGGGGGGGGGTGVSPPPPPPPTAAAPAAAASPTLAFAATKTFVFTWTDVVDATHYKLLENPDSSSGFVQVGSDIPQGDQIFRHVVPLYLRLNAQYILQSCNPTGCTNSANVVVADSMTASIGYVKASNTDPLDFFGTAISISADGRTLAIGADHESSNFAAGQDNNGVENSGAVYVFVRDESGWRQQAFLKASNGGEFAFFGVSLSLSDDGDALAVGAFLADSPSQTNSGMVYLFERQGDDWNEHSWVNAANGDEFDYFGADVSLSGNGQALAVGAFYEDSDAMGVNDMGSASDNSLESSGAVYIFTKSAGQWSQQAYIKASNPGRNEQFGGRVTLSGNGSILAVSAVGEDSAATGINGDQSDDSAQRSGAVYVFVSSTLVGGTPWLQEAYIKASNTDGEDLFGQSIALSWSGNMLAVGAPGESSSAAGINGNQVNDDAGRSGAVYVFGRLAISQGQGDWSQRTYVKSSNSDAGDFFGYSVSLNDDGSLLAVGAIGEKSRSLGINGSRDDNSVDGAGAAYMFEQDGGVWTENAYIKANYSDPAGGQNFGFSTAISGDSTALAVAANRDSTDLVGINGNPTGSGVAEASGAVFLY